MVAVSSQRKLFRFEGDPVTADSPYVPILLIKKGERRARIYTATNRLRVIHDAKRQARRPVEGPYDFPVEPTLGL